MTEGPVDDASLSTFLTGLGWSPGRRVDSAAIESSWRERGYLPSEAAVGFVTEFNGISFEYPRLAVVGGHDECVLDAVRATGAVSPSTVERYEKRVGCRLALVGLAASNHIVLLVAESGQVYGGYDAFLGLYGHDGKSALWNIYHRVGPIRLPVG